MGWEMNLKVNMFGASMGVFTAMERMGRSKRGNGGHIVNTASIAGLSVMLTPCLIFAVHHVHDFRFQVGGLGPIGNIGYNMAKHGLVALTRGFSACEPNTYDAEGIKCYALAPWFANTRMVRSTFEMANKDNVWQINGKSVQSMDDLASVAHMRALTVPEVGDAFMRSFEYDKV
jgi:NAD(P)-dependent dehydrogenase (short-subunit alcohol dehydrogenase family)